MPHSARIGSPRTVIVFGAIPHLLEHHFEHNRQRVWSAGARLNSLPVAGNNVILPAPVKIQDVIYWYEIAHVGLTAIQLAHGSDLLAFLADDKQRNAWIDADSVLVYVRRGFHPINGKAICTLDLARIDTPDDLRRQGRFTRFINFVEGLDVPIYVENVGNPHLSDFLARRGYQKVGDDFAPSFFRPGNKEMAWRWVGRMSSAAKSPGSS